MTEKNLKHSFSVAVQELRAIADKIDKTSGSPKWTAPEHDNLSSLVWQLEKKLAAL